MSADTISGRARQQAIPNRNPVTSCPLRRPGRITLSSRPETNNPRLRPGGKATLRINRDKPPILSSNYPTSDNDRRGGENSGGTTRRSSGSNYSGFRAGKPFFRGRRDDDGG